MRSVRLLPVFFVIVSLVSSAFSQHNEEIIDYQSQVVADGSTAGVPVGYSFDHFGPFTAYDKIWIFYSNGTDAVWRTKHFTESAEWSDENIMWNANSSPVFNMAFDGKYFHFIRGVNGDLMYRRGEAQPDGSIQFDDEVTAYSDPDWKVRFARPRHYAITVDHNKNVWVGLKVGDGDESDSNFKPIALASVATDGTWEDREGFPVDLAPSFDFRGNGRAHNVIEISPGNILFTWSNDRRTTTHPNQGLRARLWSDGSFGGIEVTELPHESAKSSLVVPEEEIVLLNSRNRVSRRNSDGTWQLVDPDEIMDADWNVLTVHNGNARIWHFDGNDIEYQETQDNGGTWGPLTTKWSSIEPVFNLNGTHAHNSQGSHHSLFWATGESPFDLHIGIDGTLPLPNPPALVSPADGTTELTENVTLTWEVADLAFSYDLQVATDPDFSTLVVDETGITETTEEITDLELNVVHYWRVRSVSEGGTPSDWSEEWQFETVGISPAPVLTSPSDGAENQSTSLTFLWEDSPGAETYKLQIATVSDFSATFYNQDNLTETEQFVDGFNTDQVYYWRVRAINEFGEGDWSEVWSFSTGIDVPSAPVLTTPDNESTDQPVTLTFVWDDANFAESYRLQVSKVSNFTSTVVNTGGITDTSYEVSGLEHSQTYYWRVNASNESGTSSWSPVWEFTTIIERPEVPVLVSPADGADEVSTKPEFVWEVAERADIYRIQIATAVEFDSILVDADEIEGTMYSVTEELNPFTTYYWRVNASNIGGTSDWSDGWAFETGQALPIAPVLESPDDGSTGLETEVMVMWNAVPTATHYHVQIADNNNFETPVVDNDGVTNTFFTVSELDTATQYYWRVRAVSDVGTGEWSEIWNFTTKDVTSVRELADGIPVEFKLNQNYPNPFNPTTTIRFGLPEAATVRLEIYNMIGQRIATLIAGEFYTAGTYEAVWDALDESGNVVSSGLYIYRLSAGDYVNVKKMMFTK